MITLKKDIVYKPDGKTNKTIRRQDLTIRSPHTENKRTKTEKENTWLKTIIL